MRFFLCSTSLNFFEVFVQQVLENKQHCDRASQHGALSPQERLVKKKMRREALSLYARILRLHRQKLPFEMRQLGDEYVR
jgi:hypothetical protein